MAERFPVKLVWPEEGLLSRSIWGWAERFDERSVRVVVNAPPPKGGEVRLQFEAPEAMTLLNAGMNCDFPATILKRSRNRKGYELRLQWARRLTELVMEATVSRRRKLGLLVLAVVSVSLWFARGSFSYFWYDPLLYFYSSSITVYFFSRFLLSLVYRPPKVTGYEPTVTVVIAVHNDEKSIIAAARSCWEAEYPQEKREVIVVDDGSTDRTPEMLAKLHKETPEIQMLRIPHSGKRAAMAKAFREAKGEIVVVMDSDSMLDRLALKHIVCGFEDRTLGAAAGWTGVANANKNLLTRMQEIRYIVSFDLLKTSESLFSCVSCCPGCLSAYRREYLMPVIEPWLKQTFLGVPSTFGDDRSLTNFILRDYRVIYNPLARSTTVVPDNWVWYMRQQCRWKKSWLREAPNACRILARKHPIAALSFYMSGICSLLSPLVAIRFLWNKSLVMPYVDGLVLLSFLTALFALWKKPTRNWYASWYWIATQVLLMGPQTYYALFTVRRSHWGTR